MEDFYFETNNSSDIKELVDLAKTNYDSGDIINIKYINWQYLENPFGKPFMVVSRERQKKELIGQYIVIPQEYFVDGQVVKGTLSLNTLTRKDFRGRGLFTKMALNTYENCATNNHLFTVGFPNQNSYPGFVKKLDFIYMGDVPLLIKPLNPVKIFINKLKKQDKHGGEIELKFKQYSNNKITFDLFSFEKDRMKYDDFWNKYKLLYKVQVNKSIEYLKWRYSEIPTRNYKIIKFEENNIIVGLIILRGENTLGSKTALVMDVMLLENKENQNKRFLKYIKTELKQNKIELLACLISENTLEYKILRQNNFFKVPKKILPQPIPYILRINKQFEQENVLKVFNNWKIVFGDYDIF